MGSLHTSTSRYLSVGGSVPAWGRSFHLDRRRKFINHRGKAAGVSEVCNGLDQSVSKESPLGVA